MLLSVLCGSGGQVVSAPTSLAGGEGRLGNRGGGWFKIIGVVGCARKAGTEGAGPGSWATVGTFSHVSFSDEKAGVGGALAGCWLGL